MKTEQIDRVFCSLSEGLKLRDRGLAALIDYAGQQSTPCGFFRALATDVIPYIKKNNSFQKLVKRWEREIRSAHKKINALKKEAFEEVTAAYNKLEKKLDGSKLLSSVQGLKNSLDETRGYLEGTLIVYIPSQVEMAADALARACRLLLDNKQEQMVSDLIEIAYSNNEGQPNGIARCYFYEAISKFTKQRQKWGLDCFNEPPVCWSYLNLLERCWNPKLIENEKVKEDIIEDCERFGELLGLRAFWQEMQSIRDERQRQTHFFTVERFSKHLEIVCLQILTFRADKEQALSSSVHAMQLTIFGDSLLLLIEMENGRKTTPYLLHTYNVESGPYLFMKALLDHPEKDWCSSDVSMLSGSASQLLDRANIRGVLRKLFFKRGSRKGCVQLTEQKVLLRDFDFNTQLAIRRQIDDLKLSIFNPPGIQLPKQWLTK